MAGSLAKAGSVGMLAVIAGMVGLWPMALGLALGALGDSALSRRGQAAFLAGMAAFALGHLAYAAAFWGRAMSMQALAYWPFAVLLALLISTEFWLAPRTGDLRWPVRAYVVVIGIMAALAMALAPGAGRGVLPVSYTHLDVYKRQPPPRPECSDLRIRPAAQCPHCPAPRSAGRSWGSA